MATARTQELHSLAERIANELPPVVEEVVLTGSVSRGAADEVSDIEMLLVTTKQLELAESAEALANGVALRTVGLLEDWQERLRVYPDDLVAARVEDAALTWGGFHASGMLTLARPGDRLQLLERLLDDCLRVLQIVYALNRVWPPT